MISIKEIGRIYKVSEGDLSLNFTLDLESNKISLQLNEGEIHPVDLTYLIYEAQKFWAQNKDNYDH